ncbi:MAG: response regulator [Candidatus Eisenbacteria sp.]|nr:response regulator [Candidatus Eisenbacteria bacterium]
MTDAQSGSRILVVEDDINLRTILKLQLERAHYSVRAAEDGEEGLRLINEEIPDLVLLDVMMPGMDGWEVCRRIKTSISTANVPIIMLTAMSDQEDKVRGLTGGANDYLTKPYELDELLVRVSNLLQWGQMQRAASPLTGLPGNIAIENEVSRRIELGEKFAFFYIDIDNFKGFNDYYSFQKGDEAIRLTASILVGSVTLEGSGGDFVGHVGGDDFVLIVDLEHAENVIQEVVQDFDRKIPKLYTPEDRAKGFIEAHDRKGNPVRFPIMTLTVAAVTNEHKELTHMGEISQIAAELKAFGKQESASVVVWERRAA